MSGCLVSNTARLEPKWAGSRATIKLTHADAPQTFGVQAAAARPRRRGD